MRLRQTVRRHPGAIVFCFFWDGEPRCCYETPGWQGAAGSWERRAWAWLKRNPWGGWRMSTIFLWQRRAISQRLDSWRPCFGGTGNLRLVAPAAKGRMPGTTVILTNPTADHFWNRDAFTCPGGRRAKHLVATMRTEDSEIANNRKNLLGAGYRSICLGIAKRYSGSAERVS